MNILVGQGSWIKKVNFIDENNVAVGYDLEQDCCERAGWFIAETPTDELRDGDVDEDWGGWVFDTTYCEKLDSRNAELDEGSIVVFRMIKGDEERFLHLFNSHNGYYSHGFDFTQADQVLKQGLL